MELHNSYLNIQIYAKKSTTFFYKKRVFWLLTVQSFGIRYFWIIGECCCSWGVGAVLIIYMPYSV